MVTDELASALLLRRMNRDSMRMSLVGRINYFRRTVMMSRSTTVLLKGTLGVACLLTLVSWLQQPVPAFEDAAQKPKADADHGAMHKEHEAADAEHEKWMDEIAQMRIEHRKALAALARVEAMIFEHDAELEQQAEEIRQHSRHLHHHEAEIAAHEASGDDSEHAKLARQHAEFEKVHAAMKKSQGQFREHHSQMTKAVKALSDSFGASKSHGNESR